MTIQRQYSLPNCTLVLEGLSNAMSTTAEARPLLSILINAECYLSGREKPLTGGREFFDSLVQAVNQYAQQVLSGVQAVKTAQQAPQLVELEQLNTHTHRLSVRSHADAGGAAHPPAQVDLSTVQLFDLVEAVDQCLADTQTLPDMTLQLQPLPKRQVVSEEPVTRRVVPAAIGLSSVALAAIALLAIPVPKIKEPDDLFPQASKTEAPRATTSASQSPQANASPNKAGNAESTTDLAQLAAVLDSTPEITDPQELDSLRQQVSQQIDQAWKDRDGFPQDLVYRIGVAKDGAIVGYKTVNEAANTYAKQTPLLDLVYQSVQRADKPESIAQFKVVFTPSGVAEVAPWKEVMTPPVNDSTEITDVEVIKELQPKLYDQIDKAWKAPPTFKQDVMFRVRVKADGSIADYRPESQAAADAVQELPLAQLGRPEADGGSVGAQEPLALFKVVFKPSGTLEVSPWRGTSD